MKAQAAKPVSIMKALSGTFAFKLALVAAIAVVAVLTFRAFAQPQPGAGQKFTLKIGRSDTEYVDVKSKDAFDQALKALAAHEGQYDIRFLNKAGEQPIHPYRVSIKTDKVITSEVAQNAPAEESAAYDPNAVYNVKSNSATDIKNVLDTFKE
jgi:hypothetical protein